MHLPEKFLLAMIVVAYAAVELMLLQHGASTAEMAAALLVAVAGLLALARRARRATRAAAAVTCGSCAASDCATCASAPRSRDAR